MADDAETITKGREALARIRQSEKLSFQNWCAVGRACQIGRREAMSAANVNAPRGSVYNMRMRQWLKDHGFDHIDRQDQHWAVLIADNACAVAAWRDALPENRRCRFTRPHGIYAGWRKSLLVPRMSAHNVWHKTGAKPKGQPIRWPGDMIRRAATAMAESRSNDRFVIARLMLDAAIRTTADLLDLVPAEQPAAKPSASAISHPEMAV